MSKSLNFIYLIVLITSFSNFAYTGRTEDPETSQGVHIHSIPPEILDHIFQFAATGETLNEVKEALNTMRAASHTCTYWNAVASTFRGQDALQDKMNVIGLELISALPVKLDQSQDFEGFRLPFFKLTNFIRLLKCVPKKGRENILFQLREAFAEKASRVYNTLPRIPNPDILKAYCQVPLLTEELAQRVFDLNENYFVRAYCPRTLLTQLMSSLLGNPSIPRSTLKKNRRRFE
jgi:hypothetical protein